MEQAFDEQALSTEILAAVQSAPVTITNDEEKLEAEGWLAAVNSQRKTWKDLFDSGATRYATFLSLILVY